MASSNPPPYAITQPYANNGDKASPIAEIDVGSNAASLDKGIPAVCSQPLDTTGLPVRRTDFNALGFLATSLNYFMQNGGAFTFDSGVSTAIGGYALGAKLWATIDGESAVVRSLKNNNTDNFVITPAFIGNGTSWAVDLPVNSTLSAGTDGYRIESDGFITQWMLATESSNSSDEKAWPIPFPTAVFSATGTPTTSVSNAGCRIEAISTTGIIFMAGDSYGNGHEAYVVARGN